MNVHLKPLRLTLGLTLISLACTLAPAPTSLAEPTPTATAEPAPQTDAAPPATAADPISPPAFDAQPLPAVHGPLFATSGICATCHTAMVDGAGKDVSIDTDWRASMMANAARDPYWQATVRAEVLDYPGFTGIIEDKCATCHTAMAHYAAAEADQETTLLDGGFLDADHPRHAFAIDGVSCTLCHQITDRALGDPDSFTGGFDIDTDRPSGQRLIYGPFPALPGPARNMQRVARYIPTQGPHVRRSQLCATCHTLYTPRLDDSGQITGEFPEQVPYLEWLHGDYRGTHACQDCHMPPAEGAVRLAVMGGGPPRAPIGRHVFIGGNAYVLRLLWASGEALGLTATADQFSGKIDQTLAQLQERTATLAVEEVQRSDGRLTLTVAVRNETGHKLPTGYPARRVWLHLAVRDAAGVIIFESGGVTEAGEIIGNSNDTDPRAHEPHYREISNPDRVQIYEAILESGSGEITTGLLRATTYRKDNRLLPSGFDKSSGDEDIAVHGEALTDDDFTGGGDLVTYHVDLSQADRDATLSVTAALLYQSISTRWAENLRHRDGPEISHFLDVYEAVPNRPVTIATVTIDVAP